MKARDGQWGDLLLAEMSGGVGQTWHVYIFSQRNNRNPYYSVPISFIAQLVIFIFV